MRVVLLCLVLIIAFAGMLRAQPCSEIMTKLQNSNWRLLIAFSDGESLGQGDFAVGEARSPVPMVVGGLKFDVQVLPTRVDFAGISIDAFLALATRPSSKDCWFFTTGEDLEPPSAATLIYSFGNGFRLGPPQHKTYYMLLPAAPKG